ncbi:hypothetical protein QVD17_37919 [Tagetes erecta]|uniref:Uncharacterized protein n=1 Tax=Tagetes erecta TaxID=13708 RepID=A0AAD8JZ66_TARER|nr:hypothetical protein QVD17_37919 [Tagetes erecta]
MRNRSEHDRAWTKHGRARDLHSGAQAVHKDVLLPARPGARPCARIYDMILEMMIGMLDDMKLDKCAFFHKIFEKMIVML